MIVVIPTIRSINLDYLDPLIDAGARFIVVDDSEGSVEIRHPQFRVYNWRDQRRILGQDHVAIPRRNGACRDFGYYLAWMESDDDEVVVAVDDDCIVEPEFADQLARVLTDRSRPAPLVAGRHWNMLDAYVDPTPALFPRGFPYSARVGYEPWSLAGEGSGAVKFNLGLWQNVFDVNAVDTLQGPPYTHPGAQLRYESVVVPEGVLVSVCAGNTHFRRELVPAAYNFPMHTPVMPGWVIDRYGDIWAGYVLKMLMDRRADRMSVGAPMIFHLKAGNFQKNIWQEHLAHLVNEEFIALIGRVTAEIEVAGYLDMMDNVNQEFWARKDRCSPILRAYLDDLNVTLGAWVRALRARAN